MCRSSCPEVVCKKGALESFAKFTENACARVFFNEVADWALQLYQKRDTGTGVFLWILRNLKWHHFIEHIFYNTSGQLLLFSALDFLNQYKLRWSSQRHTGHRCSHRRCSVKKVFLEISQNSQENTCARVSFLIKLQAFLQNKSGGCFCLRWKSMKINISSQQSQSKI